MAPAFQGLRIQWPEPSEGQRAGYSAGGGGVLAGGGEKGGPGPVTGLDQEMVISCEGVGVAWAGQQASLIDESTSGEQKQRCDQVGRTV